jgi:hypothetical protein
MNLNRFTGTMAFIKKDRGKHSAKIMFPENLEKKYKEISDFVVVT